MSREQGPRPWYARPGARLLAGRGVPIIRCSECPRLMADAATARRRRGIPQRSPLSATCSDRCERAREARFRREARERGYRLAPGDWYCRECGCVAEEALARREREGLRARIMLVDCSPECARARVYRRNAAVLRELQRTPKEKARRSAWERERRKTAPRGRSS